MYDAKRRLMFRPMLLTFINIGNTFIIKKRQETKLKKKIKINNQKTNFAKKIKIKNKDLSMLW